MNKKTNQPSGNKSRTGSRRRTIGRQQLYEVTASCFNERGYHGTSLADIASRLGITKAALYYYVPDKRSLLFELYQVSLQAARASIESAKQDGHNGLEKLRLTLYNFIVAMTESPTACLLRLEEDVLNPEEATEIVGKSRSLESELKGLVAEGIADGSIIPCDPRIATFMLVGTLHWVPKWYRPDGQQSGHQLADNISAMCARALAHSPVDNLPVDAGKPLLIPVTGQGNSLS